MIEILKSVLGFGPKVSYTELLKEGATIIDVRTPEEFEEGHIENSVNIPLNSLRQSLKSLEKNKPIIACCATGMRSGSAKTILKSSGFKKSIQWWRLD